MIETMSLAAVVAKKMIMSILCKCIEIIVIGSKASAASCMQHSLQHVSLTLSQVSKINRQSIHNFVKNDDFEYVVKCRYTKSFLLSCARK